MPKGWIVSATHSFAGTTAMGFYKENNPDWTHCPFAAVGRSNATVFESKDVAKIIATELALIPKATSECEHWDVKVEEVEEVEVAQ